MEAFWHSFNQKRLSLGSPQHTKRTPFLSVQRRHRPSKRQAFCALAGGSLRDLGRVSVAYGLPALPRRRVEKKEQIGGGLWKVPQSFHIFFLSRLWLLDIRTKHRLEQKPQKRVSLAWIFFEKTPKKSLLPFRWKPWLAPHLGRSWDSVDQLVLDGLGCKPLGLGAGDSAGDRLFCSPLHRFGTFHHPQGLVSLRVWDLGGFVGPGVGRLEGLFFLIWVGFGSDEILEGCRVRMEWCFFWGFFHPLASSIPCKLLHFYFIFALNLPFLRLLAPVFPLFPLFCFLFGPIPWGKALSVGRASWFWTSCPRCAWAAGASGAPRPPRSATEPSSTRRAADEQRRVSSGDRISGVSGLVSVFFFFLSESEGMRRL